MRRTVLFVSLASLIACSDAGTSSDAGPEAGKDTGAPQDSGSAQDSGSQDSGSQDSGSAQDSGAQDSGAQDSGAQDSGDASADGATDASADGGLKDSGVDAAADSGADSGVADSGVADSGVADSGVKDSGADSGGGSVWATPTCDGTIGANEYGSAQNSFTTMGGQQWSMTWNATNLYVALTSANTNEGVVLYIGYGGMNALTSGQVYDNTAPGSLIFMANAVVYAKQGYNEVRVVSNNAWTQVNGNVTFCKSGNDREIVIPWTLIGAANPPASFRWVGYATSGGGFVYAQVPETNPSGAIGTNATFPHDYFVSSTANGSGAFPFATVE